MTSDDHVLRTGVLFKKGSGNGPFGRRNWKPRYFVLTASRLKYYTYEDGDLKGDLDLKGCSEQSIEVMPADSMKTGSSASTIWRIAINAPERRLLVAAGTELEMNDWVEQLLIAFRINSGQPLPPQRNSLTQVHHTPAPGAITSTIDQDMNRSSITDFQSFAVARKSVAGAMRNSVGAHMTHEFRLSSTGVHVTNEFRLSDEQYRQQQEAYEREEQQRMKAQMEAEQLREEELLKLHIRDSEEDRRQQHEDLLEQQRQKKREKHERERLERERQLREKEMQELERQHERELQAHFDEDSYEVVPPPRTPPRSPVMDARTPPRSPAMGPNAPPRSPPRSPAMGPSTPPRSSAIADAKKEAMKRQEAEHQRQREATIKEQQNQLRNEYLAEQKRQQDELRASHVTARASTSKPYRPSTPTKTPPTTPPTPTTPPKPESMEFRPMTSYEF